MKTATVIGLGRSGIAAAKLLTKHGYTVTLSERNQNPKLESQAQILSDAQIAVRLGNSFTPTQDLDLIVVSPGVPWDLPALVKAKDMGIETIGELELAWRYLDDIPWLAVTGTNGKTTTTSLIAAIFQAADINTTACGNIGFAACELALSADRPEWIVAEVSSYQIESSVKLAPQIGIWTTFTADHLERHHTLDNYFKIKKMLIDRSQNQVINGNDLELSQRKPGGDSACWTSVTGVEDLIGDRALGTWIENGWVIFQGEPVLPTKALKMPGAHNLQNLLMAVAASKLAGISNPAILEAVSTFPGVAHRLEYVCTHAGVDYFNDSKATNYDAAEVGLASVEAPAILIAGGEIKQGDDRGWIDRIQANAAAVLLIGSAAPQFAQRLTEVGYTNFQIVETMAGAIDTAPTLAQKHQAKVVLLSPACASFDQYSSFEHRGDDFRQLCLAKFKLS
jgi:UDP-N-acetylmuramoylalanine--D-glutamate ligase